MNESATTSSAGNNEFDISPYTNAALRLDMNIRFSGQTPAEVFEVMGDPERITDWFLLAKEVEMLAPGEDGSANFDVIFTFFGRVHEEILHWDMPRRYVYKAVGDDFPIKDYVALIDIRETDAGEGVMVWRQYFDNIEGEHNQRILPVILPRINQVSLERLAPLIGGTQIEVVDHFQND